MKEYRIFTWTKGHTAGMTILFFLFLGFFPTISFSQDSTKPKTEQPPPKSDTLYKPVKFILSDLKYSYINQSNPDTVTRKRFLWYPMKNTEDIFNFLRGYYLNYMDVGQFNPVSYNQFDYYNSTVLRNGRPMTELYGHNVDYNLLSRNELAEIELTNGFSNNLYGYMDAVNIIQRQIFQNRPYTEISFTQDRYENIYFDGNFHANLFRNLNLNFGITKQSYDGKYVNSDFDKWLGRFNLNFAASGKLNFFAYVNYAKIQKGLNGGIIPDTINLGIKSEVFDPELAVVRNSDAYEKKERFDVDAGAVLTPWKNSFTKIQFFTSNSFRQFRDEENRLNSNGYYVTRNEHWINYGVKLQQVFNFSLFKKIEVMSRSEGEYNNIIREGNLNSLDTSLPYNDKNIQFLYLTDALLRYKNIFAEGYIRGFTDETFKYVYYYYGFKGGYSFVIDSTKKLNVYAQYNCAENYIAAGVSLVSGANTFSADIYQYDDTRYTLSNTIPTTVLSEDIKLNGINLKTHLRIYKFDLDVKFSTNFNLNGAGVFIYPKHHGNADLSFHDMAFRNKLEYKVGLTGRAWSAYKAFFYDGVNNTFGRVIVGRYENLMVPQNGTLDFYIMGKIGKATFGLTLENILDRVVYNTGVYPFTDRGGTANVISRFNITWNFFD